MKVAVIGSGGREHALCWRLSLSPSVDKVYCIPGNPGTETVAENVSISVDDLEAIVKFCGSAVDLAVIGPENPLNKGLSDALLGASVPVFGPSQSAARLESSKAFAKEIMESAGVNTASYREFSDKDAAREYSFSHGAPLVLKNDALAAGKGVCVVKENSEIDEAIEFLFGKQRARKVLVEKYLEGKEASYIVAVGGGKVVPMAASHDYKRLYSGQDGPNTGGMGSVSPTPHLSEADEERVLTDIIQPVLRELGKRGVDYTGFLYAGLMIEESGRISVLEFNVRMGDPECQSILRRLKGDFGLLLYLLATGGEDLPEISWDTKSSVCVVAAAEGYPYSPRKGDLISGIEDAQKMDDVEVYHAGTARNEDGQLITAGGRVLSVTAMGETIESAREKAFDAMGRIRFAGKYVREDVGLC
ncbi:MAG: phosphoribosylamine--glycine ligase [Candidatus Dadabacteria bacterium]|nr:MAG: phosphoribosylamine--glycine ligase [Candidatus Dadabacteria bacterium]